MTDGERRQLDEQGFVVLENCMGGDLLRELRQRIDEVFDVEGDRAGREFRTEAHARRLANLVDKGEVFRRAIVLPRVVECVRHVLGPQVKLSSLNARSADPNGEVPQPLHVDMAAIPDEQGYWVCNTVWMLDDFTAENGATRVIPGSHKWGRRPQDVLADLAGAASAGGPGARPRRQHCGDECARLAWRHRQSHAGTAPRDARVLLPARQAAAAIPETAASAGSAGQPARPSCARCSRSTIR